MLKVLLKSAEDRSRRSGQILASVMVFGRSWTGQLWAGN